MLQDGRALLPLMTLFFMVVIIIIGIISARRSRRELFEKIKKEYGKKRNTKASGINLLTHHKASLESTYHIDSITAGDMELDRIFASVNHTSSCIGQEYLYYQFMRGRLPKKELDDFEELMRFFNENEEIRNQYRYQYECLGKKTTVDIDKFLDDDRAGGKSGYLRHIACYCLFILAIILLLLDKILFGSICMLVFIFTTISMYFSEKTNIHTFLDSAFYIVKLVDIGKNIVSIGSSGNSANSGRAGINGSGGGKKCSKLEEILSAINKKNTSIGKALIGSRYVFLSAPANTGFLSSIVLYINLFFHIDILLYYSLEKRIRTKSAEIRELYDLVGLVEAALAVDSYRESQKDWCRPEFIEKNEGEEASLIEGLYHPLLSDPVKNRVLLRSGMLITGANASGKSTYLRALGNAVIMAQTINTVCAESYKMPFHRVYSSMTLKDSLKKGDSFFMTEIKAIKRILDEAKEEGDKVLCLVDEVLKGTNTIERIAAASQVIRYLIAHQVVCIFATHDMELSQLLRDILDNYHFEEAKQNNSDDILFTYKLIEGPTTSRNAIRLLGNLGIDGELVEKARKMATRFEETGNWSMD